MRWIWFGVLSIVTAIIDWFVIRSGIVSTLPLVRSYILGGWFFIWVICVWVYRVAGCNFRTKRGIWNVTKSGAIAVQAVGAIAQCEDFLYMCGCAVFDGRPFYPIYCHSWIENIWEPLVILGYDWLGVPSGYYFGVGALVILIVVDKLRKE